ncbi:MAG: hypothetical protein VX265_19015 [Myxococcota bacterium]|nr:hypothetical protein [Myxococcota bacterium]
MAAVLGFCLTACREGKVGVAGDADSWMPLFEPEFLPMDRQGAPGVEWGVILHGLGP